jgi:adenylate cyclase
MKTSNWLGLRPLTPVALPARVKAVIAARQREGEILIGRCQHVLVALFAALYAAAPKPTDAALAMMEPVPVVLFAYFAFTVARLRLAYLGLTPALLLLMSISIDIALLMGLIWSFYIQYAPRAAFYLKAPTILHGFTFIALRALRLEPRYVLATGIAAAVGWIVLLIYALAEDGGVELLTGRD